MKIKPEKNSGLCRGGTDDLCDKKNSKRILPFRFVIYFKSFQELFNEREIAFLNDQALINKFRVNIIINNNTNTKTVRKDGLLKLNS